MVLTRVVSRNHARRGSDDSPDIQVLRKGRGCLRCDFERYVRVGEGNKVKGGIVSSGGCRHVT